MNADVRTPALAVEGASPSERAPERGPRAPGDTDAPARRGGAEQASASPPTADGATSRFGAWWAATTRSVWWPVAWRFAVTVGGTLGLAAIGAASLSTPRGVALGAADTAAALDFPGDWIARPADAGRGHPPAPGARSVLAHPHPAPAPTPPSTGVTAEGKVILNTATAEELDRLPGVGRKRAEAIVALRTKLGRFRRLADLLRIRGIGPRSLAKLKPHLVLDPPPAQDAGVRAAKDADTAG